MDFHVANVWVHVVAGAFALAVGLIPLLSAKGGSIHRRGGRAFVWLGAIVLSTALVGIVFYDPPAPLIAASAAAGYQYLSSLRALQLKGHGPGLIDATLAAAGLAACAALYVYMGPGTSSWTPAIGYSTIGYVAFVALYDLSRHAWSQVWRTHVRPIDHGLKMTGAYFAMMSAGVGNIFRDMQPWSQVGPSIIGLLVILLLAAAYSVNRRRAAAL
ncbi:MAG: hypothetical protein KF779_16440 [Hyphomonadaceae bacterium]|nr:hypothetical protein [Hyphomonadaceae bacterium]